MHDQLQLTKDNFATTESNPAELSSTGLTRYIPFRNERVQITLLGQGLAEVFFADQQHFRGAVEDVGGGGDFVDDDDVEQGGAVAGGMRRSWPGPLG